MINKICILLLFIFIGSSSQAQESANTSVDRLLEVNQTIYASEQIVDQIIEVFKQKHPSINAATWSKIKTKIDSKDFYNKVRQLYLKNYTDKEIKSLIKLYTPQTMNEYKTMNQRIEQQLYMLGSNFGKNVVTTINTELKQQGY